MGHHVSSPGVIYRLFGCARLRPEPPLSLWRCKVGEAPKRKTHSLFFSWFRISPPSKKLRIMLLGAHFDILHEYWPTAFAYFSGRLDDMIRWEKGAVMWVCCCSVFWRVYAGTFLLIKLMDTRGRYAFLFTGDFTRKSGQVSACVLEPSDMLTNRTHSSRSGLLL